MEPAAGIVDLGRRFGHQCEYRRFIRVLMIISNDKRIGYNIISALYLIMDIHSKSNSISYIIIIMSQLSKM